MGGARYGYDVASAMMSEMMGASYLDGLPLILLYGRAPLRLVGHDPYDMLPPTALPVFVRVWVRVGFTGNIRSSRVKRTWPG